MVTDQNLLETVGAKVGNVTWGQMIAIALIRKAAKGNERAAEIIFDRTRGQGKVAFCSAIGQQSAPLQHGYVNEPITA